MPNTSQNRSFWYLQTHLFQKSPPPKSHGDFWRSETSRLEIIIHFFQISLSLKEDENYFSTKFNWQRKGEDILVKKLWNYCKIGQCSKYCYKIKMASSLFHLLIINLTFRLKYQFVCISRYRVTFYPESAVYEILAARLSQFWTQPDIIEFLNRLVYRLPKCSFWRKLTAKSGFLNFEKWKHRPVLKLKLTFVMFCNLVM